MKKHLFLIASLGVFTVSQAQVYVKKNTTIKINPKTLYYVDGSMTVEQYDRALNGSRTEKISNEGYVKIKDNLIMKNKNNGADFVNELTSEGYGQLIVKNNNKQNEGKISSKIKFGKDFGYQSLAFPFLAENPIYMMRDVLGLSNTETHTVLLPAFVGYKPGRGGGQQGFDRERSKNPIFYFDNVAGEQVLANLEFGDKTLVSPDKYYAVNLDHNGGKFTRPNKITAEEGTPNKNDMSIDVTRYSVAHNKSYNKYGEQYGSYVIDFTKKMPAFFNNYNETTRWVKANGFGDNIFMFGNPYTSNINLFGDSNNNTFKEDVVAIVQFDQEKRYNEGVNLESNAGNISTSYGGKMTAMTGDYTGDQTAIYVRPYHTFAVKLSGATTGKHTFKFTDAMKTFEIPTGSEPVNVVLNAKAKDKVAKVNQVGLDLYDNLGFTGVKTYVVASDIYEAGKKGRGVELTNVEIKDKDTSLYTLQENADGSVNEQLVDDKAYINGVNADKYVGKPIHLVLQNAKGEYTIKARLNSDLAKNKNSFYFEDKTEGKLLKVDKDFSYTFKADGTNKDRFVLYWASTPKPVLDENLVAKENSTVVYKNGDIYKVRFDKSIKKADVFVYNISGQLVNVNKGVSTFEDYIIPIKGNASVYIVKIVGDNGKITTKKIIK